MWEGPRPRRQQRCAQADLFQGVAARRDTGVAAAPRALMARLRGSGQARPISMLAARRWPRRSGVGRIADRAPTARKSAGGHVVQLTCDA